MDWVWINQDELGDRQKCEFECTQALLAGREVVIDRCNFDERQRSSWVRIAQQGSHRGRVIVVGLHLDVPVPECIRRAEARDEHPTLNGTTIKDVILRFNGMFQSVRQNEGLHEFYRAASQQDIEHFIRYVGPAMSYPPAFNARPQIQDGLQQRQGAQPLEQAQRVQQNGNANPQQPLWQQPNAANALQVEHWRQQQAYQPGHIEQPNWAQMQAHLPAHQQHQQQAHGQQQPQASSLAPVSPPQSNVVPFPAKFRQKQAGGSGTPGSLPAGFVDGDSSQDLRPVLLFDLNGTLTSHRAAKRSSGRSLMRPGITHLRRLQEHFRLGIFTSATQRTLQTVLPSLEEAAGAGQPLFADRSLHLHRGHTVQADDSHMKSGGKDWDTVKPLHKWFQRLDRVLLMDDDAYKAVPGEEGNMILVHCWEEEEPEDMHLKVVVDILLTTYKDLPRGADVRLKTQEVSAALRAAVAANIAQHASGTQYEQEAAQEVDTQDADMQLEEDDEDDLQIAEHQPGSGADYAEELALAV